MIDRQRPRRLASERAKAYFLGDVSISRQLAKEDRELRQALKVSRMEAQRARKNRNENKSLGLSDSSSPSSLPFTLPSSSPTPPPSLSASKTTKGTKTASIDQKRKPGMGKPKAMEISAKIAKDIKDCYKSVNQTKPDDGTDNRKPKFKWIIKTRSQNVNGNPTNHHVNYPIKSRCKEKEMLKCDMVTANHLDHSVLKVDDILNGKNGSTKAIPSPIISCATLSLNGDSIGGLKPAINGTNCDKPRPKIMAQRKFASITYNCNTFLKPSVADLSSIKELFTKHKPSAEDFLTFLCFRSTDLLPPHLDFYALNSASKEEEKSDTATEKTANGTIAANTPTANYNNKQSNHCNLTTSSPLKTISKGLADIKAQRARKRSSNISMIRKTPVENGKKLNGLSGRKTNNTINGKDGNGCVVGHNKKINRFDLKKQIVSQNKPKALVQPQKVNVTSKRTCKTLSKSNADEDRPKKSSSIISNLPLEGSPEQLSAPFVQRSQVKVFKAKKKVSDGSQDDPNSNNLSISTIKVTKRCLSQPKISNITDNKVKANISDKVVSDRILRSTRKSSTSSSEISPSVEKDIQPNGRRKVKTVKKIHSSIVDQDKYQESAINEMDGRKVGIVGKRKFSNANKDIKKISRVKIGLTEQVTSIGPPIKSHETSKKESSSIQISNRKRELTEPVSRRVGTRSHAKR